MMGEFKLYSYFWVRSLPVFYILGNFITFYLKFSKCIKKKSRKQSLWMPISLSLFLLTSMLVLFNGLQQLQISLRTPKGSIKLSFYLQGLFFLLVYLGPLLWCGRLSSNACWVCISKKAATQRLSRDLWGLAGGFVTGMGGPSRCWRSSEERFMSVGQELPPSLCPLTSQSLLNCCREERSHHARPSVWEGRAMGTCVYSPFLTPALYPALISLSGTSENSVRKIDSLSPCGLLLTHSYLLLSPVCFIS